jgi:hypothetical protein
MSSSVGDSSSSKKQKLSGGESDGFGFTNANASNKDQPVGSIPSQAGTTKEEGASVSSNIPSNSESDLSSSKQLNEEPDVTGNIKKNPGEITIINDERLTSIPKDTEPRNLGSDPFIYLRSFGI